jgi:signal transduction histidine kinase/tetratricopeptide (TPR) repeat protein
VRIFFAVVVFFIASLNAPSQTRVADSLRRSIAMAINNDEKIASVIILSNAALNPDTLLPYLEMAERIAAASKNETHIEQIAFCRASYYIKKDYTDSGLAIINSLLAKSKKNLLQKKYLEYLFFKSKIYDRRNEYSQAINQLMETIEVAENQKDTAIQIQAKTGIGWVLMEMEKYNEALDWLYRALHTSANKKFYKNYGALYSNIASAYNALGNGDSAEHYIDIAIADARENESLLFLATALSMQAKIFIDHKKSNLAEAPLHEAIEIRKRLNDDYYTVYDMSNLASYYASSNQPQKGIPLCLEGIALAKQRGLHSQLLMIYKALAENYKAAGNTAAYSNTLEDIIVLKDSFNSINSSKQIAELQARNATQKNEKTILEQKLNLTVKNYWLFGSLIFAAMGGIIFALVFTNYRRRQQQKMQAALQLEKKNAAQSIIEAEEQERRRIAADLHDNIGAYASAIRADVEKITVNKATENIPALQNLQQHSHEIITSLRDTIWVLNKENITITGISDRVKNYINKLQPSYNDINIVVVECIDKDVRISSKQALNIFRIIQEAVHNALKHSRAKNISVFIESNKSLTITISDDGVGIKITNPAGNGLINMRSRAEESGLQLTTSSNEQAGTVVTVLLGTTN